MTLPGRLAERSDPRRRHVSDHEPMRHRERVLHARIAELMVEWRAANDRCDRALIREGEAIDRAVKAEAERDRLKAALTEIAALAHANENSIWRAPVIARDALSDPSGDKP